MDSSEQTPARPDNNAHKAQVTPPTMSKLNFMDATPPPDMAGSSAAGAAGPGVLAATQEKISQALAIRDDDPERAVQLLGEVVEARVQAYGEHAYECASAYFHYGSALFEQAQAATDILGDPVRQAAQERAAAEVEAACAEGDGEEGSPECEEDEGGEQHEEGAGASGAAGDEAGGGMETDAAAIPAADMKGKGPVSGACKAECRGGGVMGSLQASDKCVCLFMAAVDVTPCSDC